MGWRCQAANHYLSPCWPRSMLPYGITRSQCVNIALCIWVITVVALTHWVRVTHVCVSRLTITGSENGLSPGRRQAIIWTNAGLLLFGPLGANFSEILIKILAFSFTKMRLKVLSAKWRSFCLGLNELMKLKEYRPFILHWEISVRYCKICEDM